MLHEECHRLAYADPGLVKKICDVAAKVLKGSGAPLVMGEVDVLPPRDEVEISSLKNAFGAQAQIAAKPRSTLNVSNNLLVQEWNRFLLERSRAEVGRPAKTEAPRTFAEWITIFTSQK